MTRPLLLIDVDGPLNPYAASNNTINKFNRQNPARGYKTHQISGYKVRLARWHGAELKGLARAFDLVWATTWEQQANTEIGPRIGLPDLPVISFKDLPDQPPAPGLYWKTSIIADYCKGRPFAWIDDEISHVDEQYITDRHTAPAKLMKINPATGLTPEHFDALETWAAQLKRQALYTSIGKILRSARHENGLTSADVADRLGVRSNTVITWELAIRHIRLPELVDLCRIYNIDPADLITNTTKDY
jgi:DNA-binding XRE family transcriptional regulator